VINSVSANAAFQPAAAPAAPTPPGGQLGKDEFLKMLVAQLRNQDPLNPMQGDQMATQLAQFSSVEQLTNLNKAIEGQNAYLLSMAEGLNSAAALSVVGKTVTAFGDGVYIDPEADEAAVVRANVGSPGGTATLKILDREGNVVGTQVLGDVRPGEGTWSVDRAAQGLEAGWYRYEIEIQDSQGKAVPVQTYLVGRIDGIQFTANGPVLRAGPFAVPYGSIVEIHALAQPTPPKENDS
jgi:flagellar basal-body rod modification protein FlgD